MVLHILRLNPENLCSRKLDYDMFEITNSRSKISQGKQTLKYFIGRKLASASSFEGQMRAWSLI